MISRLFMPRATRRRTLSSAVGGFSLVRCSGCDIRSNSSMSFLTAIDGLISDWPSATSAIAWPTSSMEESLSR